MQKWEYKTEFRTRETKAMEWDNAIPDKLNDLGNEGWELVAISPRSGRAVSHYSSDVSGLTTEELWVFKRLVL